MWGLCTREQVLQERKTVESIGLGWVETSRLGWVETGVATPLLKVELYFKNIFDPKRVVKSAPADSWRLHQIS